MDYSKDTEQQQYDKNLTSAVGESTGVCWSQKIHVERGAISNRDVEWLRTTISQAKEVYAGFASSSAVFNGGVFSFNPDGSNCATVIWPYEGRWHLSADVACKTVPAPRKISITQRLLAALPNTVDTAPRVVKFCVNIITTASITRNAGRSLKSQKNGKRYDKNASKLH